MTMTATSATTFDELKPLLDLGCALLPLWWVEDGQCTCFDRGTCRAAGKHPNGSLVRNGVKSASSDPTVLREWLKRAPLSNWGVATGLTLADNTYLIVLDVDTHHEECNGKDSLQGYVTRYGELPATIQSITGGNGEHYFFRTHEPVQSYCVGPGLDLQSVGKYVVIPPSVHKSGTPYFWEAAHHPSETPLAVAPEWLLYGAKIGRERPQWNGKSALDSLMGAAFQAAGLLGIPLDGGKFAVRCPRAEMHSDGRGLGQDSSTIILPSIDQTNFGGFHCSHASHGQLKWHDVLQALPADSVAKAKAAFPLKPQMIVSDPSVPTPSVPEEVWKLFAYKQTKSGAVIETDLSNVNTMLTYANDWRGVIRYNEFSRKTEFTRQPPWFADDARTDKSLLWQDSDANRVVNYAKRKFNMQIDKEKAFAAVEQVAQRDAYHPVQDWLNSLTWDGVPRIASWLPAYIGCEDSMYTRMVGPWWLISAVARIFDPGCKADYVLILEGPQGIRKSTALRILAVRDEWFCDTSFDLGSKDAFMALNGRWIIELAELDSLARTEISKAKAFFTSPSDTYRPPYGRETIQIPRQCVFAGTINGMEYLKDDENRRYWPVLAGTIDTEKLLLDRNQIWAEAVSSYRAGAQRYPITQSEREICAQEQSERVISDAWTPIVANWLDTPEAKDVQSSRKGGYIKIEDILGRALKIPVAQWDYRQKYRVGRVMSELKWQRRTIRGGGERFMAYVNA